MHLLVNNLDISLPDSKHMRHDIVIRNKTCDIVVNITGGDCTALTITLVQNGSIHKLASGVIGSTQAFVTCSRDGVHIYSNA